MVSPVEKFKVLYGEYLTMVLEVIGKFRHEPRSKSSRIQIPARMVWDSAFPLREGGIIIRIEGERLTIKNYECSENGGR